MPIFTIAPSWLCFKRTPERKCDHIRLSPIILIRGVNFNLTRQKNSTVFINHRCSRVIDEQKASLIVVLSPDQTRVALDVHHPLSVWQGSGLACPSASRETIILLLIHLLLHCSPNQSPVEWDAAKLQLPSCGCPGNRDSGFAVMSARCCLAVWALTRPTLVGE